MWHVKSNPALGNVIFSGALSALQEFGDRFATPSSLN
jgi:hypothetical protein